MAGTLTSDKGKTQVVLQSCHSQGLNKTHIENKEGRSLLVRSRESSNRLVEKHCEQLKKEPMKSKFVHFAGVDVSKQKIDVCVIVNQGKSAITHGCFEQSKKGFNSFRKWLNQTTNNQTDKLLVCVENTGLYDDAILYYLSDNNLSASLENAANIKRSVRDNRTKTDKVDARNIALYAMKHYDELRIWEKPRKQVVQLQLMLSERSRLVNALKMLKQASQEQKVFSWSGMIQSKPYQSGIRGCRKTLSK